MEHTRQDFEFLFNKYDQVKSASVRVLSRQQLLESELKTSLHSLSEYQQKLSQAIKDQNTLVTCSSVIKQLIDSLSTRHITQVQSLLTVALKTIFFDRDYQVEFVLDDKRNNRSLELFLVEKLPSGDTVRAPFEDGVGGGLLSVAGFVLQVYYLLLYHLRPVIFCDESFTQLSDQYIPYLMEFIKQLSVSQGLSIVLVSHDPRFISQADQVYRVEDHTIIKE